MIFLPINDVSSGAHKVPVSNTAVKLTIVVLLLAAYRNNVLADSSGDLFHEYEQALSQEDYQSAVAITTKAIAINPNNPVIYLKRAEAYIYGYPKAWQYQKAIDDCSKALSLNAREPSIYSCRAR